MEESRAKSVDEMREDILGPQIAAGKEGKQVFEELQDLNPNTELDCKEFGEHVRNGGWRLGLLVARNVYDDHGAKPWEDEGISRRTWYRRQAGTVGENSPSVSQKISARAFARQSGNIDHKTVLKYLSAWNMAAAEGLVPSSSDLNPGASFEFSQGEPE